MHCHSDRQWYTVYSLKFMIIIKIKQLIHMSSQAGRRQEQHDTIPVTELLSIPHLDGAWPPDPLPKLENGIHQCFCMGRTAWNVDVNRDNSVHTPHHWVRVVVIATTIGTAGSVCKAGQWSVCDSNIMFGLDQSLLTNHLNLGQLVPVVQRNIQLQVVKLLNAVQSRSTDSTFGLIR